MTILALLLTLHLLATCLYLAPTLVRERAKREGRR